jgi:hypothetical protein
MNAPAASLISVFFIAALASVEPAASAQSIAYDGFSNGPLSNLAGSTGGAGWSSAWANASSDTTGVQGAGLQFSGLQTSPGGAVTPAAGGVWPSSIYQRTFAPLPPGATTMYVSFLMRDDAAWGSFGGLSFGQYPNKMSVGSPLGYYAYGLMMSQGLGDVSNKPLVQGETTLVVVKITKNSPSGVTYRMYLDPTINIGEPSFPAASFTLGPVSSLPTSLSIDNGTGFTTDEIRVGLTWASVLPAATNPWTDLGFAKPGSFGAPHLTGSGPLSANSSNSITLSDAKRNAPAWLIVGATTAYLPALGGVLVPTPDLVYPFTTNASGTFALTATWPVGIPANTSIYFQSWIQDPGATLGLAASNGLRGISQ